MRVRIERATEGVEVSEWHEQLTDPPLEFVTADAAAAYLRRFLPEGAPALRRLLRPDFPVGKPLDDHELVRRLSHAILARELRVTRVARPPLHGDDLGEHADDVQPNDTSTPPRTWVEFELVDQDGAPVAGERYRATLVDGEIREGRLDKAGLVRFDGLPEAGECSIVFPERDVREAEASYGKPRFGVDPRAVATTTAPITTWVEFELVDEQGTAVPEEPYALTLPDGTVRRGRLDKKGRIRLESVPPGDCRIEFPERDARA